MHGLQKAIIHKLFAHLRRCGSAFLIFDFDFDFSIFNFHCLVLSMMFVGLLLLQFLVFIRIIKMPLIGFA